MFFVEPGILSIHEIAIQKLKTWTLCKISDNIKYYLTITRIVCDILCRVIPLRHIYSLMSALSSVYKHDVTAKQRENAKLYKMGQYMERDQEWEQGENFTQCWELESAGHSRNYFCKA